jgi:high affinity Mn2+ porin
MKLHEFWGLCTGMAMLAAALPVSADPVQPGSAFYFGGNVGYGFGTATAMLRDPGSPTIGTAGGTNQTGALFGGVQGGYEYYLPSRLMLGFELDASFTGYMDLSQVMSYRATGAGGANEQLEYLATARGRVGYGIGSWTPFLTGGFAWASTRLSRTDFTTGFEDATAGRLRAGYVVGAGIDHALDKSWSARLEYLYTSLGATGFPFGSGARYDSQYDLHRFRIGLNYRFGQDGEAAKSAEPDDSGPGSFEIHGQSTFIFQGYPAFSAPYDGPNSLPAAGQARQTWTTSLFLGVRLWRGGEFYFNPELLQGFGVASTTGAGGYPNGEAQKSNFPYPRFNPSRFFLRQEFGFGGETEKVEGEYGQLAGTKDVSRITLQVGKYAVHDLFDTNDYAQDSRIDFMNWSIWASGAFDYAADRVGLTYGATAELNQADWAVRAGYFLLPVVSNGNIVDWSLLNRGEYVTELELRFKPFGKPGTLKGGLFLNSGFSGSYNDAVVLAATTGIDANTAIAQTRQTRIKYGYYLNLQQEITDDIGVFGRWSWNDGRNEIIAFTDIDASLALGASIKGTAWSRPDDRIGVAGALNMLSSDHIAFLAAGGTGPLVGDGQLPRYTPEKIIEAYYAAQLFKGFVATADYQLLIAPAYNADRGPAHVFAGRLRASF